MIQQNVKNVIKTTLTASIICTPILSHAHGEDSGHGSEDLGTTTHVGRRALQDNNNTTSSLLTIKANELPDIGTTTLVDSLTYLPGVLTSGGGQEGTIKGIRIRGLRPEDTQVRVDGVRLSRRLSNLDLFVGNLGLAGTSKIELLKGGQSSLYGASANGGVLNISSKKADDGFQNRFRAEAGSFNSLSLSLEHSGTLDKEKRLKYSLFSSFSTTDNDTFGDNSETSGFDNDSVTYSSGLRLDYELNSRADIGLTFRRLSINTETPQSSSIDSQFLLGTVFADIRLAENWQSKLTFSYLAEDTDFRGSFPSKTDYDQFGISWENNLKYNDNGAISFGAEYENNDLTSSGTPNGRKDHYSAVYANHAYTIDQLTIDAGLRYEDYNSFGNHTSWQAGALYHLQQTGTKFRANISSGFNTPDFIDLFGFGSFSSGNPNLDPETTLGWDIGFEQEIGNQILSVSFFETDIDDLIETEFIFENGAFNSNTFNSSGKTKASGIEATIKGKLADKIDYNLNYTWLDRSTAGQPEQTANATIVLKVNEKTNLGISAQYLDQRSFGGEPLEDAFIMSVFGNYQINDNIRIHAKVNNVTDTEYSYGSFFGTNSPARRLGVHAGVTVEW